MSLVISLVV